MEPLPEILSNVCALIAQVIMLAPAEQRRALCIHVRQELEAVVVAVSTDEDSEEFDRRRQRREREREPDGWHTRQNNAESSAIDNNRQKRGRFDRFHS